MYAIKALAVDIYVAKLPKMSLLFPGKSPWYKNLHPFILFIMLLLLWFLMPAWLTSLDQTSGIVDSGIWMLIVLTIISFLLALALSWWLLQKVWLKLGLPSIHKMVSQFNTLSSCIQLSFYWASFALLLVVFSMILIGIC